MQTYAYLCCTRIVDEAGLLLLMQVASTSVVLKARAAPGVTLQPIAALEAHGWHTGVQLRRGRTAATATVQELRLDDHAGAGPGISETLLSRWHIGGEFQRVLWRCEHVPYGCLPGCT